MALIDRLNAIGDAIREKNGTTDKIPLVDMPQAILDIVSGGDGGVTYKSIVFNDNNTITLTEKNGVVHTMEWEYTDGKISSVEYDGKSVDLEYEGDVLVKVGNTTFDINNITLRRLNISANMLYWNSFSNDELISDVNVTVYPTNSTVQSDSMRGILFGSEIAQTIAVTPDSERVNLSVGCWVKVHNNADFQRLIKIDAKNDSRWYSPYFSNTFLFFHDVFTGFSTQIISNPNNKDGDYHYLAITISTENGITTIKEYWDNVLCYITTGNALGSVSRISFSDMGYFCNGYMQRLWIIDKALSEEDVIKMSEVVQV